MTVRSCDPESGQESVRKGVPSISGNDHVADTWCETESIVAQSKHVGISREMGHSDRIRVKSPFKSSMGQNHKNWLARQGRNRNTTPSFRRVCHHTPVAYCLCLQEPGAIRRPILLCRRILRGKSNVLILSLGNSGIDRRSGYMK
jgi:hypothetical protein